MSIAETARRRGAQGGLASGKSMKHRTILGGLALACAALVMGCPESRDAGNPTNTAQTGQQLSAAEVDRILAGAAQESLQAGVPMAVAVCDREGEVLGVWVTNARDTNRDGILETPGETQIQAAISKAALAAAFESEGEAFTTRTAYFIVQGHYPPGAPNTPGGPLFGVQDSGQPSSDSHIIAWDQAGNAVGVGLFGGFGGVPIFRGGAPVGGVGVEVVAAVTTQGNPGALTLVGQVQKDIDEAIALRAVPADLAAPPAIRATNVFVDGIAFPFAQNGYGPGATVGTTTASLPASTGSIDPRFPVRASPLPGEQRGVDGRYGVRGAQRFLGRVAARTSPIFSGTFTNVDRPAGVTFDPASLTFTSVPITTLTQTTRGGGSGEVRFPFIDSVEPPPAEGGLTQGEVGAIIDRSATDALSSVAGIRLPRGSRVAVSIAVVDLRGNLLGLYRMADGTLFSLDIAVQKARTAAFFSSDGVALTPRGIGFLAQPFFPPGIQGTEAGPLVRLRDLLNRGKIAIEDPPSLTLLLPPPRPPSGGATDEDPITQGNQLFNDFAGGAPAELALVRGIIAARGGIPVLADRPDVGFVSPGLQSGMQTFPGGVPLYRGNKLIGAVGASGDGVDEDDAAAFAGSAGFGPPPGARSDDATEAAIVNVLTARLNTIVAAVQAHPDLRIRNVYGPIVAAERDRALARLSRGLQGVRIPFVKLPRNPQSP